jgi:hypothetical protein
VANGTFDSPATDLAVSSKVCAYDSTEAGGVTNGTPNTDSSSKCIINDRNQSEKCATSISYQDYYFITEMAAAVSRGGATAKVDAQIEVKEYGGVWRPVGPELELDTSSLLFSKMEFEPYIIVPKNSDVRMVATSTANGTFVTAFFNGILASIVQI